MNAPYQLPTRKAGLGGSGQKALRIVDEALSVPFPLPDVSKAEAIDRLTWLGTGLAALRHFEPEMEGILREGVVQCYG
jgi:hypothetical protein